MAYEMKTWHMRKLHYLLLVFTMFTPVKSFVPVSFPALRKPSSRLRLLQRCSSRNGCAIAGRRCSSRNGCAIAGRARMASPLFPESLNLLYDGKCSVCQWEVENLMSLGGKGRIAFTDIESPDFDPTAPKNGGVSYEAAMGKITAVTKDGDVLVGIPVFAACYEIVGLGWLFTVTRWPLIGTLIGAAYAIFAAIRTDVTRGKRLEDLIAEYKTARAAAAADRRCQVCANSEAVPCPNCGAQGYYVAWERRIKCTCCHGSGRVICRACFRGDPWDLEAVRRRMRRMPD